MKFSSMVYDADGKPIGRYETKSADLTHGQVSVVREFLVKLQKGQLRDMSKETVKTIEACNMVFLAGTLQLVKVNGNDRAFCLVDPGGDTKYLPCTIYEDRDLTRQLEAFTKGDMIQIRGWMRIWSQKKNDEWRNNAEVRITEIRNRPPERKKADKSKASGSDDGLPWQ